MDVIMIKIGITYFKAYEGHEARVVFSSWRRSAEKNY